MEPNNIERAFKEKLEERTIKPSKMAWDRLDAMLSVTEEKKQPKKSYRAYLAIAAGFLGFLLVATLLLKQEDGTPGNDEIRNTTVVNTDQPSGNDKTGNAGDMRQIAPPNETITNLPAREAVAAQHNFTVKTERTEKSIQHHGQDNKVMVFDNKQEEAVAVHITPERESENLLASSLSGDSAPNKKSGFKVDASSLLSSVEGELDNNFRNEVLQKVVKNYNTVKTSVANRNYQ